MQDKIFIFSDVVMDVDYNDALADYVAHITKGLKWCLEKYFFTTRGTI